MYRPHSSEFLKFKLGTATLGLRAEDNGRWLCFNFQTSAAIFLDAESLIDIASVLEGATPSQNLQLLLAKIGIRAFV